jgi:hypothetical protein
MTDSRLASLAGVRKICIKAITVRRVYNELSTIARQEPSLCFVVGRQSSKMISALLKRCQSI